MCVCERERERGVGVGGGLSVTCPGGQRSEQD